VSMANYSFDDVALLAQIRADILNHPSAYSAGEIFLKEQYGPQRLHKDALADWERDKDHPTQQASHRDSARYLTRAIADATERETRYRETVEQLSDAPRLDQWTHAACASQAIQGLRDAMADGHQDAKTLAVLLLAVMLWDADADTRHAIFTLFGPWGVTPAGEVESISRWAATVFLDDEANFRRWMDTVRMAWTAMQQTGAGDALSASAHAPTSTQPPTPDAEADAEARGDAGGPVEDPHGNRKAIHSSDYTFVNWFGTEYTFALGVQSSAVKALLQEWERSGLGLHQDTIREAVDPERDSFRMDIAFRNHRAFGTMIQRCGDGRFKLAPPSGGATPAK